MQHGSEDVGLEKQLAGIDLKDSKSINSKTTYVPPFRKNVSSSSPNTMRDPSGNSQRYNRQEKSSYGNFPKSSPGGNPWSSQEEKLSWSHGNAHSQNILSKETHMDNEKYFSSNRVGNMNQYQSNGNTYSNGTSGFGSSGGTRNTRISNYSQGRFNITPSPRDERKEKMLFGAKMNTGINFSKYEDIPVEASGQNIPIPISNFEESHLDPLILSNIVLSSYTVPTPVQKHAVAIVSAKRDLMACAQTGSGKTASFLVPVISECLKAGPPIYETHLKMKACPLALILAPTRELATQIFEESLKFSYRSWVRPVVVYGGVEIRGQFRDLSQGCDLLVATPGRLVDMLERGNVSLVKVKYLVLDEADKMLDMGFEPDIRKIVDSFDMPDKFNRQTLMFSATFPKEIQLLARDFLKEYIFLSVGRVGSTSENIVQKVIRVEECDKRSLLVDIIESNKGNGRILIFIERKRDCDILEEYLLREGFETAAIHGDRTQWQREEALKSFRNGRTPILIATAVASRGLDIPNVAYVIIYDFPTDIDEYVHRIGRTGRAGNVGTSIAFFTPENANTAKELIKILREANQEVPIWLEEFQKKHIAMSASAAAAKRNMKAFYNTPNVSSGSFKDARFGNSSSQYNNPNMYYGNGGSGMGSHQSNFHNGPFNQSNGYSQQSFSRSQPQFQDWSDVAPEQRFSKPFPTYSNIASAAWDDDNNTNFNNVNEKTSNIRMNSNQWY